MQDRAIKVLLVEDNPGDARLLQELLKEVTSVQFELAQTDCLSRGLQLLLEQAFDVVLLDLSLPDSQGLETFVRLHDWAIDVPIVVITGFNDETLAVRAVQAGAQDYLVKGQVSSDLLVRSIRYAIERNRTEHKIREQAALLDIATDAIIVRDLESRILFWNKGAERLYGWAATAALGQKANQLLYPADSTQFQVAQQQLLTAGEWYGELSQVTRSGQAITVASRWTLMRDKHQQPKSVLVVSTDITEKKLLEAQFLRAQRMESIGTLAGGIAHDLNNILTPILATAQLLQMKLTNIDARSQQMLKSVEINTKRGAALVQQVLSFARGVEGKRTILQVKHVIAEIEQIIAETFPKSIAAQIQLPQDLWTVVGNATQIHQVLMNLCVNARDAMPDGGTLTISAQNLMLGESDARRNIEAHTGAYIEVTVADTGTGITEDIADRIFEPFFTTKEVGKGTGLGLSTVVGIIKSHGGFIKMTSTPGAGTQFRLFLPAVQAIVTPAAPDPQLIAGQGETVLVVDDEAAICEVSQTSLETYGYRALTAHNGNEAIALYAQHRDEISVVVVDMMMPTMDGAATIRALHQINAEVKIIAVSGLASSAQLAMTELGIQAFLPKPYTAHALVKAVSEALQPQATLSN